MDKRFSNHLVNETSPYLLQHAHNPVNWFPWGPAALQKAREEGKVILVSIGYSACHWCHVMERESFEDEDTANLMNKFFVNIKIDREERPDLDHIYMDAVQAIAGSGGWPLNVFLTPDAKPFFGGTYFPPVKAFNRSSWKDVLNGIAQAWMERRAEIEEQAENLTTHLQQSNSFIQTSVEFAPYDEHIFNADQCTQMFSAIMRTADREWGGFGNAPKFPQTFTIQYLLHYYFFTGNEDALKQALLSIDKMLEGGIYDHVGGGLARYSTDREWLAPHFEKMLYDNALLINILCDAYQLTANKKYEDAIRKTILFATSELLSDEGGFYAALDADSEGEEGKYYVWDKQEIDELLGEDSALFCDYFDISAEGNWEGKNILRMLKPAEQFIAENKLDGVEFGKVISNSLQKLAQRRSLRVKPALDDKVLLGWNALMLKSITRASIVLQDEDYQHLAERQFSFLRSRMMNDKEGGMLHTYKKGVAKYPAFLEDYAYLISACCELYKADFEEQYLVVARELVAHVIENFSDEDGVFFLFTHKDQQDIIVRKKEVYDGATPSANGIMAGNLQLLGLVFDNVEWRKRSEKMLMSLSAAVIKYPGSFGVWAGLLLQKVVGINEVAIIGKQFRESAKKVKLEFNPNMILMGSPFADQVFPLLADKKAGSKDTYYLCKNYACREPTTDVHKLLKEINSTNKISA